MRIALIVPGGRKEMEGMKTVARPPLGVCYLKSYLAQNGHETRVFHQVDESESELVKKVSEYNPDIAGFSTMSCVFDDGVNLAQNLKQINPKLKTVFGGEHITGSFAEDQRYEPGFFEESCSREGIDYFIPFEGEKPLLNLVNGLASKVSERSIPGILFKHNGKWEYTVQVPRVQNLDELPIPDRSDLPYDKYCSIDESNDLEYMHTGRGCRFKCSYCATPVSNPGKVSANSAKRVLDEMEDRYINHGRTHFFFADELFTFDTQRVSEICQGIKDRGLQDKIQYRVFARVDDVTKNRIDLQMLRDSGCNGLFFGVESMNEDTLMRLHKGTTPEMIEEAISKTYEAGIPVWASLMVGYPWETEEQLRQSLNRYASIVKQGKVFHTYSSFITPFPGTDFHHYCRSNGLITNPNYLMSDCSIPSLRTPIPEARLIEIHRQFRKEIDK
ncbi:MAG TPA: radical SAM protein [Candidatus Paceibacterota bacterium]|nr:radical SAM protein [Candidatus Paceibacterota bacterium]